MFRSLLLPAARALRARRSLILAYHGVSPPAFEEDPHNLLVPPERFRSQIELLLDAGFEFMTVAELAERVQEGVPPPGLAALSFDDGMEDNHTVLLPILRHYGIPATVYVTTGLIGRRNPWMSPSSGARMMTADELRSLAAAGVELGAHSVNHPDLSQLDREACLREMAESRLALEGLTGQPVRTFAYPFCRYGDAALAAARESGFIAAVTCEGRGSWDRFEMKRAMLTGRDGPVSFALKVSGAYQPLFESPPGRLLRSATRAARARIRGSRRRAL
jgi:peptidoglycan/xylan/chitin deacetylase (PgdA/CDA1 family)